MLCRHEAQNPSSGWTCSNYDEDDVGQLTDEISA